MKTDIKMKNNSIKTLSILALSLITNLDVHANDKKLVSCLTGTTVKTIPEYGNYFLMVLNWREMFT